MIGDSQRQPHQLQHRFQQAFCLAQPQAKHKAQRQGGLDAGRHVSCVLALATWTGLPASPTGSNCRDDEVLPHILASSSP